MSSVPFREKPIIIVDVETTGLNPAIHEVIDIGAIKIDHDLNLVDIFSERVRPEHIETAEPEALAVNGYNPADWWTAPSQVVAAANFNDFSAGGILCAWNIMLDYGFLKAMFHSTRLDDQWDLHRLDIPSMVWALDPDAQDLSLVRTAERLGVEPEPKPHSGLQGAQLEWKILRRIRGK